MGSHHHLRAGGNLEGFPGRVKKPAFERFEKVKLYEVAFISRAPAEAGDGLFCPGFHSPVGQLSQKPDQGHLLKNSRGSQMNRKMCSGLKEPTQCAEDRQVNVVLSP